MDNKLKIGTIVKLNKSTLKFFQEYSDSLFGFTNGFKSFNGDSVGDQLSAWYMFRESLNRGLDIDGVIVGDNGYTDDTFAYLVWMVNELGEDIAYIETASFEIV